MFFIVSRSAAIDENSHLQHQQRQPPSSKPSPVVEIGTGHGPLCGLACGDLCPDRRALDHSYFTKDLPALGAFLKGHDRLVKNGRIDRKALAESHMTMDDLEEDLREKGVEDQRASRKRAWSVAANCR